jgi:hypothetical protein
LRFLIGFSEDGCHSIAPVGMRDDKKPAEVVHEKDWPLSHHLTGDDGNGLRASTELREAQPEGQAPTSSYP